ncbi:MAG: hypothetical protein L0229_10200 [Blastocatellia bacterium]|nr:hypothetical protein [Blastocatellia bacterium]
MDKVRYYLNWLKEYGKDYVLENTALKFLALLITAVLWLSVGSRPVSQIPLPNVPIVFHNLPDTRVMTISSYDTLSARVYLQGPRDVLDTIRSSELTVVADLSGVEPGVRVIPLKLDRSRLPASVEEESIDPRNIRITLERVVEREVVVIPRFDGKPPEGYEFIRWSIIPPSIQIFGAESQVEGTNSVSTETVSLRGKTRTFSDMVAIDLGSPNINVGDESNRKVLLTVEIDEMRKERVIENVPVTINGGPPSAQAVPRSVRVTLFGAESIIGEITPDDLIVSVDYQAASDGRGGRVPTATLKRFGERVMVRSITPGTIRIR